MFELPKSGPTHPLETYERIIKARHKIDGRDVFEHLRDHEPDIGFIMRTGDWTRQGRAIFGSCSMPGNMNGPQRPLFLWMLENTLGGVPDFLFTLNSDWWDSATDDAREVLLFHEMKHADCKRDDTEDRNPVLSRETGSPTWQLAPHDVEEFADVVRLYGAWNSGLIALLAAAAAHGAS